MSMSVSVQEDNLWTPDDGHSTERRQSLRQPIHNGGWDACDRLQASEQQQSRNVWDVGCQCRPGRWDLQQLASSCEGCRVPGVPLFACLWQQGR